MKIKLTILLISICLLFSSCSFSFGYINVTTGQSIKITDESTVAQTTQPQTTQIITTPEITTEQITTPEITTATTVITTETVPPQSSEFETELVDFDKVQAESAFVYNLTDDELLAIKGQDKVLLPASITKLLSIQYALTIAPTTLEITPQGSELALVGSGSSIAYIKTHHRLTVAQLIKGMMLPSGNDAAYALAAGVARYELNHPNLDGNDAVKHFVRGINEYAQSLGCTNTFFTVPDGLAGDEHYTSLHDLIIIGKNAMKCDLITEYSRIVSERVKYASGHFMTWNNTNRLINPEDTYYSPYVTGLKTGSLNDNYCLYISADINDTTYLIGIFKSPTKTSRYDDAHIIIDSILDLNK